MELWIRSQDKNSLIKVENLYSDMFPIDGYYRIYNMPSEEKLGKYLTKERALEVLDEIQENIIKQGQLIILTDERGVPNGSKFYSYVYEMPEE